MPLTENGTLKLEQGECCIIADDKGTIRVIVPTPKSGAPLNPSQSQRVLVAIAWALAKEDPRIDEIVSEYEKDGIHSIGAHA